jgi:hypothetical protein
VLLTAPACALAIRAQCVDSSQVIDFKVRSVKFRSLFGSTPKRLRQTLEAHRGEPYSSDRASAYINEIVNYRTGDPVQQKYESLIANKLKLSVKGGKTELECVRVVDPAECAKAFPGSTQCVDVTIRRYFVELDVLDSSPQLLPLPRSTLTALYAAIPRPLLALNPWIGAAQDSRFGLSAGVDTVTDLLDLHSLFAEPAPAAPPSPGQGAVAPPASPTPAAAADDDLVVTVTPGGGTGCCPDEEPPASANANDTKLLLRMTGQKSLSKDFYETSTGLTLERTKPLDVFQNLALEAKFVARHLPRGEGDLLTNGAALGFATDLRLKDGPFKLLNVGGKYRWSRNRFFGAAVAAPGEVGSESGFEARVVADGNIAQGLTRAALWFDGGSLDHGGSYRRFAALVGYGKEFALPRKKELRKISPPSLGGRECWTSLPEDSEKNQPTVGVELLAGAGRAWGDEPEYARFYGGSPPGQFLYDELSAQTLTDFPAGPVIRSLGRGQAGVASGGVTRGANSYWHANLNVSIPVRAWSSPLIPHEWVTLSAPRPEEAELSARIPAGGMVCRDLKATLKTLVRVSGVNLLVSQQARDLLTDDQKRDLRLTNKPNRTPDEDARLAAAQQEFARGKERVKPEIDDLFAREILPITDFIADHANLISVKPLLMFDAARTALTGGRGGRTRYGVGGGLQVNVVLARFEFGYIAGINRAPGDVGGHFVGRLIMRRFF